MEPISSATALKIIAAVIGGGIAVLVICLLVGEKITYDAIDCRQIQQESKEAERRGVAIDYTPAVTDKCYQ